MGESNIKKLQDNQFKIKLMVQSLSRVGRRILKAKGAVAI